ncbi:MAG TPA: host attachment family protein [Sphingomicrobium sp.]
METPHDASVLVTDGRKALLLRNEGDSRYANLKLVEQWQQRLDADRDLKSDGPGRSFSSNAGGTRRSAYSESDFHDAAEAGFLAQLASSLSRRHRKGEIKELIIVSPPRALGELRKHLAGDLKQAVIAEIAKDLVKHPISSIEELIALHVEPALPRPA